MLVLVLDRLGNEPRIATLLRMSHAELARLPHRVYGGTSMGTTIYLSLPMNFKRRDDGRFHALLNDRAHFWKALVNTETNDVEIVDGGESTGHFIG